MPRIEVMRLRAIEATKACMKMTDLALADGVHRSTVFRWLAYHYKGAEQSLKAKPGPGRAPKLAEPQMQSLTQAVTDQTSLQHGFAAGLWTLLILRELIQRQFGNTVSLSLGQQRHRPDLQDLRAAPDGGRDESSIRGGRWPPRSQVRLTAANTTGQAGNVRISSPAWPEKKSAMNCG